MKPSKFRESIFLSLLITSVPGFLTVLGTPSLAQFPSEVPAPFTIPGFPQPPRPPQIPGFPQSPSLPQIPGILPIQLIPPTRLKPSIFTPEPSDPIKPFESIDNSSTIDGRVISDVDNLKREGDKFRAQGQYQQAFDLYEEAFQRAKRMNLGQNQCDSQTTVVKTGPGSTSTVSGNSSTSPDGNSSSVGVGVSASTGGGGTSTSTTWRPGSNIGRIQALSSLYELGLAYFKLAQASGLSTSLNQSNTLITRVAQELGVFAYNQTTTPGQQQSVVSSTGNSTTFQVSISSGQTQSQSSACLTSSNYTLEANTFRLLEQIYLAQRNSDEALKVSEARRTIEVDKNIAYNLFRSDSDKLTQIAKDLSRGLTLDEIKNLSVDEKATIVSYSTDSALAPTKVYIWVIRNGKIHHASADLNDIKLSSLRLPQLATNDPDRGKMQNFLRGTRATLTKSVVMTPSERQTVEEQQTLQLMALYRLLIDPIENLLPKNPDEHVIFVPHDALFFVPFPALQDPRTGQYLIDKHTIQTAPNLRSLKLSRQQRPMENGKVLVVGNPKTSRDNLQGAEQEANAIEQLFRAKQRDVAKFLKEEATKENVKRQMEQSEIIHLAAHGILDTEDLGASGKVSSTLSTSLQLDLDLNETIAQQAAQVFNPSTSLNGRFTNNENTLKLVAGAIALTPGNKDDGLLTASEILSMNLKANLVVLSACDTGGGPLTAGGVIGLPLSLSLAQVPNVMVSLWSVPDTPTSQLMVEFYKQLLNDPNTDKAKALRTAMRTVKQTENGRYKNPVNWAAFTLIGTSR